MTDDWMMFGEHSSRMLLVIALSKRRHGDCFICGASNKPYQCMRRVLQNLGRIHCQKRGRKTINDLNRRIHCARQSEPSLASTCALGPASISKPMKLRPCLLDTRTAPRAIPTATIHALPTRGRTQPASAVGPKHLDAQGLTLAHRQHAST